MNIQEAIEYQKIYLYKTGVLKEVDSLTKTNSHVITEEEAKEIFYDNTPSVDSDNVRKTISFLQSKETDINEKYKQSFITDLNNILRDYNVDRHDVSVSKLNQEGLRMLYDDLVEFSKKYELKLPLDEKIFLIDNMIGEEFAGTTTACMAAPTFPVSKTTLKR